MKKQSMNYFMSFILLLLIGPLYVLAIGEAKWDTNWRDAPHTSTGQSPDPGELSDAILQIFYARSFSWRGALGDHTWIAYKEKNSNKYWRLEKIGWLKYNGKNPVTLNDYYAPDALWYGAKPNILLELKGEKAESAIIKLKEATENYPYNGSYGFWPGPNSNTFIAYLMRRVPEIHADLPVTAIGKDYLGAFSCDNTPGGDGYQCSIFGVLGILIGKNEGIEINVLSLNFGIDFKPLGLKIPGIRSWYPFN